ncbi:MAG: mechanosensitive ion channel [Ruminococcaceae bacterium]|nr:mechanosensitive ion channel [Oscillospiraceae bacterium]
MPQWLTQFVTETLVDFAVNLLLAVIIIVVGFALVKVLVNFIKKRKFFEKMDVNAQSFLANLISAALKIVLVFTAVIVVGVPEASVLAIISSCGLAIGLALQGGLSNIAGGVVIMICRPFHIGDYIESSSASGVVKDIGLYYTKLTTVDNIDIVVPNSTISNATVKNLSTQADRRIDFDFNVAYNSDLDLARKVLLAISEKNDMVYNVPAPEVYVAAHGESSVTIKLRVWCAAEDYWTVYFDMWEDVKKAFDQFEIEIPYNHLNVTIDNK